MAKSIFSKIADVLMKILNVILCGFAHLYKALGWLFGNIGKGIAKFFIGIGFVVNKFLELTFIPLFKVLKKGYNKLLDKISSIRAKLYDKSYERKQKSLENESDSKFKKVVNYIPNLLATKISYRHRQALWGIVFIIPLLIGFVYFFLLPFISTVIYSFSNVVRITEVTVTGASAST